MRSNYDRSYEGAGLGLSLVGGLVGLHGGTLSLESSPGVGTRVTVKLPLDCRSAAGAGVGAPRLETFASVGACAERKAPLFGSSVRPLRPRSEKLPEALARIRHDAVVSGAARGARKSRVVLALRSCAGRCRRAPATGPSPRWRR